MAQIYDQFVERIGRAVSRFAHHAAGEGLHPSMLDGDVILRIEDGKLKQVEFPASKRTGKATVIDVAAPVAAVEDAPSGMQALIEAIDGTAETVGTDAPSAGVADEPADAAKSEKPVG